MPDPARPTAVSVDHVTKRFDDETAVEDLTLHVPSGTILGIIGPSGAGKTTTVRMLTGALGPTEGEVRVLGEDPVRFRRATRQQIGYMPQQFTLYRDLSARENVDFVASLYGILWRTRHQRTREVLELVDLWEARGRQAGDLSGGMQRRLELACALVHNPSLMFLDEPTAGIDPLLRQTIWDELHRLRDDGRTLLVTTQYVNEAEACDNVALIAGGRLIGLATPDDLRREAIGGDVVEVETAGVFDPAPLAQSDVVRRIEHDGPRRLRVTVDDAASALPEVVEAVTANGGEVSSAREYRPSFDEVFAILVQRDRAAHATAAADDESGEAA
ncbi:MAG TPA: ABC transporter ATP-binding protein [Candidatus Saccharimonadales bacterium]|nr:ABC transporter ATP-binding protein [Candidatus Saccharimonadales bacterium]